MSDLFDTVANQLEFWSVGAWNYGGSSGRAPASPSTAIETSLREQIRNAYNSSTEFRRLYDQTVIAAGKLRIGGAPLDFPNLATAMIDSPDPWIALHPPSLANFRWINKVGDVVTAPIILVLAHELHHMFNANADPIIAVAGGFRAPNDSEQNALSWEFSGDADESMNLIAVQLMMSDRQRVSYHAASDGTTNAPPIAVSESYTDGQSISIARLGGDGDNDQDHGDKATANDLIIGYADDDVISGGAGNDHLFGEDGDDNIIGGSGDDRIFAGDGWDSVQGGSGDDLIEGGAGRDYVETGSNSVDGGDEVRSGPDDDVIVADGLSSDIDVGTGADKVYYTSTHADLSSLVSSGSADDRIYWNGYALTGGTKAVIDCEYFDDMPYSDVGCYDANGVRYYLYAYMPDVLNIFFPSGGGIAIAGFQDGHYGISVGAPIDRTETSMGGSAAEGWTLETDLPISPICFDDTFGNYADLPGAETALATPGPNQPQVPAP